MRYLALGDSISIDYYTGVTGGGAASQLAKKLEATEFDNLTRDGHVTQGVLRDLARRRAFVPELVTLTVGGNDYLAGDAVDGILKNVDLITAGLATLGARVIMNTVYDPTDGDDGLADELGLAPEQREDFRRLNEGLVAACKRASFVLCDLEALFHGHGIGSKDPWIVMGIEPNLDGATAIATAWHGLARAR